MIYTRERGYGDGQWHCPFMKSWVAAMKRAVLCCARLPAECIEAAIDREAYHYRVPPGDFLEEEQDVRGLPLSWCREYERRHKEWADCCTAIYDYSTVPDVVVTDGENDWPLPRRYKVLTA